MTIYSGCSHWKWWCSIVMLVYQRVYWYRSNRSTMEFSSTINHWVLDMDFWTTRGRGVMPVMPVAPVATAAAWCMSNTQETSGEWWKVWSLWLYQQNIGLQHVIATQQYPRSGIIVCVTSNLRLLIVEVVLTMIHISIINIMGTSLVHHGYIIHPSLKFNHYSSDRPIQLQAPTLWGHPFLDRMTTMGTWQRDGKRWFSEWKSWRREWDLCSSLQQVWWFHMSFFSSFHSCEGWYLCIHSNAGFLNLFQFVWNYTLRSLVFFK